VTLFHAGTIRSPSGFRRLGPGPRGLLFGDDAVGDGQVALSPGGDGGVVGDDDDGDAVAVEGVEQVEDGPGAGGVEVASWLVAEQQGGPPGHGARNSDTLFFPARQVSGLRPGPVQYPDAVQGLRFRCPICGAALRRIHIDRRAMPLCPNGHGPLELEP
jgi:hypothetical protein